MAVLGTAQRKKLPSKSFALPGKGAGPHGKGAGSYPIPDASHARNALSRVSQHGSSAEKATVRAKVHAKFPAIGKQGGGEVQPVYQPSEQLLQNLRAPHYLTAEQRWRAYGSPTGPRAKGGKVHPHHRADGGEVVESEEHHAKEKKLLGELKEMEEKEKVEKRAKGGPVGPAHPVPRPSMGSTIGPRKLRDAGPRYPKEAMNYVR